ncbi:MAG: glycoside hydrolase family 3 N-terminal domain-containing protein [Bacteroidota bacterium]
MLSPTVQSLLDRMSIEDKAGQMTQVTINLILEEDSNTEVHKEKLREAIVFKRVGSILNVKNHAYDLPTWDSILGQIHQITQETPYQVPILFGIDSIHGAGYTQNATMFPHNIGMGASRNDELVKRAAEITALETRASGIRWNFDPVLDVGRQPLWSRFEETFGEDTYICGKMGSAAIKGYEGDDLASEKNVASCMKHYLGYSHPISGKDRTPAYIPEIQLRELFLPPFEAAVEAGSSTIMINSGEINGVPVHASSYLLTKVLREELGFEGLAVTDWEDIVRLHTRHKVASTPKEAVKIAVNAGIDMSMTPFDYDFTGYLIELVKEGEVSEERLNEAVGRILTLKEQLGLFKSPGLEPEARANFGLGSYKQEALEAARQSMTLLKNQDATLPLDGPLAGYPRILLAGPAANNLSSLHGSWSFTWQGHEPEHYPQSTQTIKDALVEKLGQDQVICQSEEEWESPQNYTLPHEGQYDVVVLCLGENSYAESPGSINDLMLDPRQIQLAQEAYLTQKPVILVLCQGRPRIIRPIEESASAILQAYRPSSQGAKAIVETLFGDNNPGGVLPFSYPKWSGDIMPYDHKFADTIQEPEPNVYFYEGYSPQYPFGHGLSYTSFEYSDLRITQGPQDQLNVVVTVKNTGTKDGSKVVELYSRDHFASITPAVRKLRRYERVFLKVGEWIEVQFEMGAKDLSFINSELKRVTEPGDFDLMVGDLVQSIRYSG